MKNPNPTFEELGISASLTSVLKEIGYEAPTPIQAQSIPILLAGQDLLGQAQTGTGKTGAFALPLLSNIDVASLSTQVLVLTPTRELAIQISEAFQTYARKLNSFHVLPIYGGQSMGNQLHGLKRGAQVVVGTPGRIMDHLRRKSLKLGKLQAVVLDEADEMLKMGFVEDIEWILEHTPEEKQIALFSATMPEAIRKVSEKYMREDRKEIRVKSKTTTVETISQYYWLVSGVHKLDALTRFLEVEGCDATLVFVRTKTATVELAEKLEARGYSSAALNGDLSQDLRERTIDRLKRRELDILVATDVAARGLDVERITHVVNYDIPYDADSYVHRIGRTGRAGKLGKAILFVSPREMRLLKTIERVTRQQIDPLPLPSKQDVSDRRVQRFKDTIASALEGQELDFYRRIVKEIVREKKTSIDEVAAALCFTLQQESPLVIEDLEVPEPPMSDRDDSRRRRPAGGGQQGPRQWQGQGPARGRQGGDRDRSTGGGGGDRSSSNRRGPQGPSNDRRPSKGRPNARRG